MKCSLKNMGLGLPLLSLILACSHQGLRSSTSQQPRLPASETSVTKEFRLFSVTDYLPREMSIYNRLSFVNIDLKLKLKAPLAKGDQIKCRSFKKGATHFLAEDFLSELEITSDAETWPLLSEADIIHCRFTGESRHADLVVQYDILPFEPEPYQYGGEVLEQIALDQDRYEKLSQKIKQNPINLEKESWSELEKLGLVRKIKKKIEARKLYNELVTLNEGDTLEHVGSSGSATPAGLVAVSYGPAGLEGKLSVVNKNKLVEAYEEPFSLICGLKKTTGYSKILIRGKSTVGKKFSGIIGDVFCSFNAKKDNISSASGSFEVTFTLFNQAQALQQIADKQLALSTQVLEIAAKKKEVVIRETLNQNKTLNYQLLKIEELDKAFREVAPPKYCSFSEKTTEYVLEEGARMLTNSVGEFCSNPAITSNKMGVAACDGLKDSHVHGRLFIINEKMQALKKATVKSIGTDGMNASVDSSRMPELIFKEIQGIKKEVGFAVPTYDGRILFYDMDLKLQSLLKFDDVYVINELVRIGNNKFAVIVDYEVNGSLETHSKLHIIEEAKIIKSVEIEREHMKYYANAYYSVLDNKVYVSTDLGKVLVFSSEGDLLDQVTIEEGGHLSKIVRDENGFYAGSRSGKVYFLEPERLMAKLIYQAPYSGTSQLELSSGKTIPNAPAIINSPLLVGESGLVVTTGIDGRLHFLKRTGELQKIVQTNYVRGLFDVGIMEHSGVPLVVATSISYINLYLPTGEKVGTYSNSGAENFYVPAQVSPGNFMAGMYRGVFKFTLKQKETEIMSQYQIPCD